jgi:hypothetical protein
MDVGAPAGARGEQKHTPKREVGNNRGAAKF